MKSPELCCVVCLAVSLALVLGCNDSPTGPVSKQHRVINEKELPKLGELFGPLDEGRIEVAAPAGWKIAPRSAKWITRLQKSDAGSYPSIIIQAEDYESIFNVSKTNVDEFAGRVAAAMKKEDSAGKQAVSVDSIVIGSFVGIASERRGKAKHGFKRVVVERLILQTVVAGRKYTIELRTREGELNDYRRPLYAVAAGIKFHEAGTAEAAGEGCSR